MVWWAWGTSAVLFAIVWVWAFYREDKHPEPPKVVAWACFWGAVSFPVAWMMEWGALRWMFLDPEGSLASRVTLMLLVVGPVEELCKFAAVRFFIYPRRVFNEPMDGIVYSVAAATAFALAENLYFITKTPEMTLARAPGTPLLHIVFAGYWGAALGWAKWTKDRRAARRLVLIGLLIAALAHGLFDLVVVAKDHELSLWEKRAAALVLIVVSFAALRWQMARATAASPLRKQKGKQNSTPPPDNEAS